MIYLIDFENVHEEGFSALGRLGEKDAVYCFFTKNVAKISMSALASMRSGQLHFIEAESGKQSLDLVLVSYLGYLIGTKPQELYYDIISNDNGFTKVADFWNKNGNGLRVRVRKTNDLKQKTEPVKTLPQNGAGANMNSGTNGNRGRKGQIQRTADKTAAVNEEKPAVQQLTAENTTAAETAVTPVTDAVPVTAEATVTVGAEASTGALEQKQENGRQENGRQNQSRQRGQRQRTQRQRGGRQEQQVRAEEKTAEVKAAEELPAAERNFEAKQEEAILPAPAAETDRTPSAPQKAAPKPLDSSAASALEAAGISSEAIEFIRTEAEKYRDDKNMKQLVYRSVVKNYGQKKGTQIYNSAKKYLLK